MTENVHEALAASVAPDKLTLPDPAVAVIVPPPHEPVRPFGVDTTSPTGNVSVTPTPVSVVAAFGFVTVKLRLVVPFNGMLAAPNALVIVGALGALTVVIVLPQ